MDDSLEEVHRLVDDIQTQLSRLKLLINELGPVDTNEFTDRAREVGDMREEHRGVVVEGVFDGQNMVGPDGKIYTVPANYASKSKLVEGDIMKLTIRPDGSFVYKQIGPVERKRSLGVLVYDDTSATYRALLKNGRSYRLLTASVTYYKGEPGDSVAILVPQDMESQWAAVENIVEPAAAQEEFAQEEHDSLLLLDDGADAELPSAREELPSGNDMLLASEHSELSDGQPRAIPRIIIDDEESSAF